MWVKFENLSPAQSVVAQEQLAASVEMPSLKKTHLREFKIVDGHVVGSRLAYTAEDRREMEKIFGPRNVRSKTDLCDWKSTPTPFTVSQD